MVEWHRRVLGCGKAAVQEEDAWVILGLDRASNVKTSRDGLVELSDRLDNEEVCREGNSQDKGRGLHSSSSTITWLRSPPSRASA